MVQKYAKFIAILFILFSIVFSVYASIPTKTDKKNFIFQEYKQLNKGWILGPNLYGHVATDLPARFQDKQIQLTRRLDLSNINDQVLVVRTKDQSLTVTIDNQVIFDTTNRPEKNSGRIWNFVHLSESDNGKEMTITIKPHYEKKYLYVDHIYIGNHFSIVSLFLGENSFGLLVSIILFSNALFLLLCAIYVQLKLKNGSLIYVSLFYLLFSICSFIQTSIGQFFITDLVFLDHALYVVLLLTPLPLIIFGYEKKQFSKNICIFLVSIITVIFFLSTFLQVTGIVNYTVSLASLPIFYILIVTFILVYTFRRFLKWKEQTRKEQITSIAFVILELAIFIDIINYILSGPFIDNTFFTRLGFMLYIFILCYDTVKDLYHTMYEGRKKDLWKKIAFKDVLTGMYSRIAYNEKLNRMTKRKNLKNAAVILIDINNLKLINDTYGHDFGDHYIIDCIQSIYQIFQDIGKCYRIGGDEFVILMNISSKDHLSALLEKTQALIDKPSASDPNITISFSFGHAIFDEKIDKDFSSTIKRADLSMYEFKAKIKSGMPK